MHKISSPYVSYQLLLTLSSIETVNGIVRVYDQDTIIRLAKHTSLKRINIQYINTHHDKDEIKITQDQFNALNTFIRNRDSLVDCDISVEFPKFSLLKSTIKSIGIKNTTM